MESDGKLHYLSFDGDQYLETNDNSDFPHDALLYLMRDFGPVYYTTGGPTPKLTAQVWDATEKKAQQGGTVSDGDGDVTFLEDTFLLDWQVTLKAEPAEGYEFVGWVTNISEGDDVDTADVNVTDNPYTFNISQNTLAFAKFQKEESGTDVFPITVENGSADKSEAESGATVTVTAASKDGYSFVNWTSDDGVVFDNASEPKTTFTMLDKSVTVTANFKRTLTITVKPQTYGYTGYQRGESDAAYGDAAVIAKKVVVDGLEEGDSLTTLILDGEAIEVGTYPNWIGVTGFMVNDSTEATAKYKLVSVPGTLTIVNGYPVEITVSPTEYGEASGAGVYDPQAQVTLTATSATGYRFVNWASEDMTFADPTSTEVSFTMPADEVAVTANFEAKTKIAITVTKDGKLQSGLADYLYLETKDGKRLGVVFAYSAEEDAYIYDPVTTQGDQLASGDYVLKFDPPASSGYAASSTDFTYDEEVYEESTKFQYYTVEFVNYDDTVLQTVACGVDQTPAYTGDEPTRPATAEYTYTFKGWDPEIVAVTGNATYKATFEAVPVPPKKATLTFELAGGTLDGKTGSITVEANVGETIKLLEAPTRKGYTFKCWKGSEYAAGADYTVEGDHTFTAQWTKARMKPNVTPTVKPRASSVPQTGDSSASAVLALSVIALGSLCMLAGTTVRHRKDS